MVDNSKKCKNCNEEIQYGKKFCNSSCAAKYNNVKREKKKYGECIECGGQLKRNSSKYCSNKCQGEFRKKETFYKIESGCLNYHEETFKRYLIFKFGEKCMECGWDKVNKFTGKIPIQIEHVDGNSENNDIKNLKLLCPNCHSLTKTWGGANKGNGRQKRREKRNAVNA
jgi:predicted nucleic acid-binding Zn ribbon protein